MKVNSEDLTDVVARLRRAQGQLGGIIAMIEDERDCRDIVIQFAAVSKAIDRAGFTLLSKNLQSCVASGVDVDTAELEKLFLTLA